MKMPELASALGISVTHAYRLSRLGMPISSVEAARHWRLVNLDPARVHGGRCDRPLKAASPAPPPEDEELALDHTACWIALRFRPEHLAVSAACWVRNRGYPDGMIDDLAGLLREISECIARLE